MESIPWQMVGQKFEANLNVIPLGGYVMVLGVEFKETMSPVVFFTPVKVRSPSTKRVKRNITA